MQETLDKLTGTLSPIVLSALRIVTALLFFAHGTQKLFGFPEAQFRPDLFTLPWLAGLLEILVGALVLIGFKTRIAAFLMSGQMAIAYWLVHAPRSPYPAVNGGDAAILFCFVFLYIAFAGPGPISIDAILKSLKGSGSEAPKPAEAPAAGEPAAG